MVGEGDERGIPLKVEEGQEKLNQPNWLASL